MKRALVVSHEASRSGAPKVAVEVVRALAEGGWDVEVVLKWPGPMRAAFEATGARVRLEPLRRLRTALRIRRRTRPLANRVDQLGATLAIRRSRPDLVWCNTVLSAAYVRPGVRAGIQVVLHAHEPGERMRDVLNRYRLDDLWSGVVLVGCAPKVCKELGDLTGREDVMCLPSVPDSHHVRELAERDPDLAAAASSLVGACGTPDHRKGVDLWLDLAEQVCGETDAHFVWVGGSAPPDFEAWAARSGLGRRVRFVDTLDNPYAWMKAVDVMTLTSRVDCFPLVVLESMALARPVVAFDVGDVAYQIGDAGVVVAPEAVGAAAREIVALLRDPDRRTVLGAAAAARVAAEFSIAGFAAAVCQVAAEPPRRTG